MSVYLSPEPLCMNVDILKGKTPQHKIPPAILVDEILGAISKNSNTTNTTIDGANNSGNGRFNEVHSNTAGVEGVDSTRAALKELVSHHKLVFASLLSQSSPRY